MQHVMRMVMRRNRVGVADNIRCQDIAGMQPLNQAEELSAQKVVANPLQRDTNLQEKGINAEEKVNLLSAHGFQELVNQEETRVAQARPAL